MNNSKTLKFYNFKILKSIASSSKEEKLSSDKVKELIDLFIEKQTKVSNPLFAPIGTTQFPGLKSGMPIYFDVIINDSNFLFASMGQESSTNIQIRNISDLKPRQIERLQDEVFESHTYFILDYKSLFISFFSNQGAPSISNLQNLFNNFDVSKGHKISGFTDYNIHTETIADHDTLASLFTGKKQKELIDVTINLATPQSNVLRDFIPDLSDYEPLVENGIKLEAKLVISKPKENSNRSSTLGSVEDNENLLKRLKKSIGLQRSADSKSNAILRTKMENQRIQTKKLFDDVFTFTIPFNLSDKKIKEKLELLSSEDNEYYTSVTHAQLAINNIIFEEMKRGYAQVKTELRDLIRK